jgi:hypothetical protein
MNTNLKGTGKGFVQLPGIADVAEVYQDAKERANHVACPSACQCSCHVLAGTPTCNECRQILESVLDDSAMDLAGMIAADLLLWPYLIRARALTAVSAPHIQPLAGA